MLRLPKTDLVASAGFRLSPLLGTDLFELTSYRGTDSLGCSFRGALAGAVSAHG